MPVGLGPEAQPPLPLCRFVIRFGEVGASGGAAAPGMHHGR